MTGFVPPTFPQDRLDDLRVTAAAVPGGSVDTSIGTPVDPVPEIALRAMADAAPGSAGYPPSIGTPALREAAAGWMRRRLGVDVAPSAVAACVGTKEMVASLPRLLSLRDPTRDTVLYPAVSYPTYEMGAVLAGLRAVPVPVDDEWRLDVSRVSAEDAERALLLWLNEPCNPTGASTPVADLAAIVEWALERDTVVASDECYVELTWDGPPRTSLEWGTDGVLAVHSISKRSNLAGLRAGFYAGDADLVRYLGEVRKHAGFMVPGPVQAAAITAWADDGHVEAQRERYLARLQAMSLALGKAGIDAPLPAGAFYLWVPAPGGDSWALARHLAAAGGALVSPGEFYGPAGNGFVRVAVVQPDDRIALVADRLAATT